MRLQAEIERERETRRERQRDVREERRREKEADRERRRDEDRKRRDEDERRRADRELQMHTLILKNAVEKDFLAKTPRAQYPVGALRTYSKAKIHPFSEDTNHTHFIQTLVFPWRLCVFAVEVLFQLRFLG